MKWIITEVVQSLAMGSGAWLATHHIITQSQTDGWVGSLVFLAGVAYSAWEKRNLITKGA